jgi:SNF2-related domain
MSNWKLNESSKIVKQPEHFVGTLRNHQLAMLHRALSIENNTTHSGFGFLADKAGTGKTAVIISLILADKQMKNNYQTMIITPQNIIKQWEEEIKKFSGDCIKIKELVYSDIINIESDGSLVSLRDYDVLITTNSFFETVMSSLSSNGNSVYRIVYDEIDTMDSEISNYENKRIIIEKERNLLIKKNQDISDHRKKHEIDFVPKTADRGLKNKITWFVSASIFNLIDPEEGFFFLGKNIPNSELHRYFIKCNNDFIDNSLPQLEEELEEIYECECLADEYSQLLSVKQFDAINSMSYDEIEIKNRKKVPNTELDLMTFLVKTYYSEMEDIKDVIQDIEKKIKLWNVLENDTDHPLIKQVIEYEKDYAFNEKLANAYHNVRCKNEECSEKEECTYSKLKELNEQTCKNSKMSVLNHILIECKQEPGAKILIFSDFHGSFKHLPGLIEKVGFTYEDLCKGTPEGINLAIERYKTNKTDILFIQSKTEGCGLNLQNTTHLIFLHRTDERLRDQIVGRAQRTPRDSQLKIYSLYNNNEILEED